MSATSINAVDSINIANNAVTVPTYVSVAANRRTGTIAPGQSDSIDIVLGTVSTSANGQGRIVIWVSGLTGSYSSAANIGAVGGAAFSGYHRICSNRLIKVIGGIEYDVVAVVNDSTAANTQTVSSGLSSGIYYDQVTPGAVVTYLFRSSVNYVSGYYTTHTYSIGCAVDLSVVFMECKR